MCRVVALGSVLLLLEVSLVGLAAGNAAPRFSVGLGVQGRTFDTMSFSDIRPMTRGEFGGRTDVGLRVAGPWWTMVAGHFGGAWFDFNGPGASGKIEDFSWLIRGGLDRRGESDGGTTIYFGLGAEYGESRSWLNTHSTADEGPHVYVGGGYLKAGAMGQIVGPVHAYVEVVPSAYRAQARQAPSRNKFNWLGRSFEAGAGLRLVLPADR